MKPNAKDRALNTKQKTKKEKPRFDRVLCIACIMCADICPTGAIGLKIRNSTHGFRRYPILADENKCISCKFCEKGCPSSAISMK
jgi:ferredoxin